MYVYVTMYWSFEKEKTIHISWQALGVFSSHGQRQRWRLAIMDSTHPSRCGCNSFQSLWLISYDQKAVELPIFMFEEEGKMIHNGQQVFDNFFDHSRDNDKDLQN